MFNKYHLTYYFESDNKTAGNGYNHKEEIFYLYRILYFAYIYLTIKLRYCHNDTKLPVAYIATKDSQKDP